MAKKYTKNPIIIEGLQVHNYVTYVLEIVTKTGAKRNYYGFTSNVNQRRNMHWGQKDREVYEYLANAKTAVMRIRGGHDTEAGARFAESVTIHDATNNVRKASKVINKQHNQYTFI